MNKIYLFLIFIFYQVIITAPKEIQKSVPSSVWQTYAKGELIRKGDQSFINDCKALAEENNKIPLKNSKIVRIMTYNVHFWTDALKQRNYDGILKIIASINPDILVLQEVVLFDKKIKENFYNMGYRHQAFCKTQKKSVFGNMILSKLPLVEEPIVKTFWIDKKFLLGGEQRGFINFKIQLPSKEVISVYGTHLDVYDHTEYRRLEELKEIVKITQNDLCKNIIITADFNAIRKKDYQYKIDNYLAWDLYCDVYKKLTDSQATDKALTFLENQGFIDCFTFSNILAPKFSVWSGSIVDFIFLNKNWNLPIAGCYTHYNSQSDHLPIIMDVLINNKISSKL